MFNNIRSNFKNRFQSIMQKITGVGSTKILVNKVTVRPPRRQSQDIQSWRLAMKQAEGYSQQRKQLYDLYQDLLLDGYLIGVTEKRVENITNTPLVFVQDGKEIDEVSKLMTTSYGECLLKEIMNSKFWGHSLIELLWPAFNSKEKGKSMLIPRKNVKPRWGIVTNEEFDMEGVEYRKKPFDWKTIEVGEPENLGLFLTVAQYVIYKRGNFGDWAEFATIFGIPFRHATYNNEQSRQALEEGLEKAGPAGYMVTQDGTDLKIISGNPSGNGSDVFRFLRNACNEEIAYTILGNTMTTMEAKSSGYAQSKTHQDTETDKTESDRQFVLRVLNEQLIPYLEKMGYPVSKGAFQFKDEDKLPLNERIDVDLKVSEKVAIADDYWYETYGIPKPKNATKEAEPKPDPQPEPTPPVKKKDDKAIKLNAIYGIHKKGCTCGKCPINLSSLHNPKFKPIPLNLEKQLIANIKKGNHGLSETLHKQYYQRLRKFAQAGFARSLGKPKDFADFELTQSLLRNISEFAAAKQHSLIDELKNSYRANPNNFDRNATGIIGRYNDMYFKTELNTLEAAANTASKWEDFQDNIELYPNLRYSTVGDDRVRPSHAALDGAVYPVNDPFWDFHSPPLDWRCRCILLQTDETTIVKAPQKSRAGLGANPFKTKRLVQKDHPYFEMAADEYFNLMEQAEQFRAKIEKSGIIAKAKRDFAQSPNFRNKTVEVSDQDLSNILKSAATNEAIRNALLSHIILVLEELSLKAETATGLQIFELNFLETVFDFYFENGESVYVLKKVLEI